MKILRRLLSKYGSCGCVTFSLISPACADDATSLIDPVQNLVRFRDLKATGQATEADTRSAAESLDQVGTSMSINAATVVARSNPIAGLPSAALGSALVPIARSVGERAGKLTSVQSRLSEAVASGDYTQIDALHKEQDALTAKGSGWKANYGTPAETISRVSEGVNLNSSNSLVSGIESIAKRLVKTFGDFESPLNSALSPVPNFKNGRQEQQGQVVAKVKPSENFSTTPPDQSNVRMTGLRLAGTYELENGLLKYTEHAETAEFPCMELDSTPIEYAKSLRGGDSPLCETLEESMTETQYSFLGQCKIFGVNGFTGNWSKGLIEAKIKPEEGLEVTWSVQDFDRGPLIVSSRNIYASCEYTEPDCSPEGQAAWKAQNGNGPVIFCENPLQ